MLKSILNLQGSQLLSKNDQKSISGGNIFYTDPTSQCGSINCGRDICCEETGQCLRPELTCTAAPSGPQDK